MTNRHLKIFLKAAELKSMSEAAKSMYISQSSVSQAIIEIEKEYGVKLFERLSKGVYLTQAGEQLMEYAVRLISLQEQMESYLASANSEQFIRLGATITVGAYSMSPIVKKLKQNFEHIKVEVHVANTHLLERMLIENKLDAALIEGKISSKYIVSRHAVEDKLVLICGRDHKFYGRKSVRREELTNADFILREEGSGTRAQLENALKREHIPYNIVWVSSTSDAILSAVSDGHGISVISERLVKSYIDQGMLWSMDIEGIELGRYFDIVYHKDKYITPALRCFAELCMEYGREDATSHAE